MNEIKSPREFAGMAAAADGLFFTYHFDANGMKCADASDAAWTWRSYMLSDLHARQAIAGDKALPPEAKEAFLSSVSSCHIDLDDGWLHGDLPDLRHDYSAEARGL